MEKHHCPGFLSVLTQFINSLNDNILAGGHLRQASLPFNSLDIYHGFRVFLNSLQNDIDVGNKETDSIKAKPRTTGGSPTGFDTVIIMISDECQSTGLQGKCSLVLFNRYKLNYIIQLGARIGCLRTIFKLPKKLYGSWPASSI